MLRDCRLPCSTMGVRGLTTLVRSYSSSFPVRLSFDPASPTRIVVRAAFCCRRLAPRTS